LRKIPSNFSISRARYAQKIIAERVLENDLLPNRIERAVGVDLAYRNNYVVGSAVIVEYKSFKVIEKKYVIAKVKFPYIPTLLAFREVFPAWSALNKLNKRYDIVFVDGNGRLHPYKAGFACHLGIIIDKPTIGIAKKLLCGRVGEWMHNCAPIYYNDEIIGYALKTLKRAKPIYVSIGHKISIKTAIKLTLLFTRKGLKLPEPIRQAHILAKNIALMDMEL